MTELSNSKKKKRKKAATVGNKCPLVRRDGAEHNWRGKTKLRGKERQTCLSMSLWYDKFMHSSCVCQSWKVRDVCWAISRGRKEGSEEERKARREKEGAETPRSNGRKWADGGRLCSLCGFNESTVFRTRRGTRELA